MKLSIVITYYNRKQQLRNTLFSIACFYKNYDIEIIIVDDDSSPEHNIDNLVLLFPLNIKLIKLTNRTVHDPVTPFNTGLNAATGDVVLINCAECLHMGDIIGYIFENFKENDYFNFGTYSIDFTLNEKFNELIWINNKNVIDEAHEIIQPTRNLPDNWKDGDIGWYINDTTHYGLLPFCAAISRKSLEMLNGLDERFIDGIGYADNEFVDRVINLKLDCKVVMDVFCVHQAHQPTVYEPEGTKRNHDKLMLLRKWYPNRIKSEDNHIYRR